MPTPTIQYPARFEPLPPPEVSDLTTNGSLFGTIFTPPPVGPRRATQTWDTVSVYHTPAIYIDVPIDSWHREPSNPVRRIVQPEQGQSVQTITPHLITTVPEVSWWRPASEPTRRKRQQDGVLTEPVEPSLREPVSRPFAQMPANPTLAARRHPYGWSVIPAPPEAIIGMIIGWHREVEQPTRRRISASQAPFLTKPDIPAPDVSSETWERPIDQPVRRPVRLVESWWRCDLPENGLRVYPPGLPWWQPASVPVRSQKRVALSWNVLPDGFTVFPNWYAQAAVMPSTRPRGGTLFAPSLTGESLTWVTSVLAQAFYPDRHAGVIRSYTRSGEFADLTWRADLFRWLSSYDLPARRARPAPTPPSGAESIAATWSDIFLDRWFVPASVPTVRAKRRQWPDSFLPMPIESLVSPDRWLGSIGMPPRRHRPIPNVSSGVEASAGIWSDISLDRWFRETSQPVRPMVRVPPLAGADTIAAMGAWLVTPEQYLALTQLPSIRARTAQTPSGPITLLLLPEGPSLPAWWQAIAQPDIRQQWYLQRLRAALIASGVYRSTRLAFVAGVTLGWKGADTGTTWKGCPVSCPTPETLCKPEDASRLYNFDFSDFSEFRDGETITSVTSVEADVSGLTIGTPTSDGAIAQARISSGSSGTTYTLSATVVTSGGSTLVQTGYLEVTD